LREEEIIRSDSPIAVGPHLTSRATLGLAVVVTARGNEQQQRNADGDPGPARSPVEVLLDPVQCGVSIKFIKEVKPIFLPTGILALPRSRAETRERFSGLEETMVSWSLLETVERVPGRCGCAHKSRCEVGERLADTPLLTHHKTLLGLHSHVQVTLRKVVEVADRLGALTSRAHRCVGMTERVCRLIDRRRTNTVVAYRRSLAFCLSSTHDRVVGVRAVCLAATSIRQVIRARGRKHMNLRYEQDEKDKAIEREER